MDKDGYGMFNVEGKTRRAGRSAYILWRGPIPDGLVVDHLCNTRLCVNPWHLEPVTNRENILRGTGLAAVNSKKTHCLRGHEFTEETTWTRPGEQLRVCLVCHRDTKRLVRFRKQAQKIKEGKFRGYRGDSKKWLEEQGLL